MSQLDATTSPGRQANNRRRGVSRAWVFISLLIGLVVGAGATFGTLTFIDATTPAEPVVVEDAALSASQWFTEGETLPDGVTAPGTQLALGDEATVLVGTLNGNVSEAKITVTSVTELNETETELLKSVQPALVGQKLYRINYTVTFVSGDPLAGVLIGDAISPVDAEGAELLRVPVSGWQTCGETALPAVVDVVPQDASTTMPVEMCAVASSPESGADVAGAIFSQAGGPYSFANKGQITWLPAVTG
jgi:hypothetical protein